MSEAAINLVLIEDDKEIRRFVQSALGASGFHVWPAENAERGLIEAATRQPELIILDLGLPDRDGLDVIRDLRAWTAMPILILSARGEETQKVAALDAGADDYLTKPFAAKELSARIRALLRRIRPMSPGHARLVFGDLELIPEEGKVMRNGSEVHLTKTEFRLLCELAENPGKVFSREAPLDKVWGYDYFGDGRLVDVHVRRLRTKVEVDPANPRHVVTVRGLGYRLQT
jgi:DNA-binding response OmpR family regulator